MDKPVYAAKRFRSTWRTLDQRQRERIVDLLLALPDLMAQAHRHTGWGFRRLHGSDFWEARLDLRWRLILKIGQDDIVLFDVMNHDQVRRL